MTFGEEHMMDGGAYSGEDRIDVYVKTGKTDNGLLCLNLVLVTGATVFTVVELKPADLKAIGKFLLEQAFDAESENIYLKDHKV